MVYVCGRGELVRPYIKSLGQDSSHQPTNLTLYSYLSTYIPTGIQPSLRMNLAFKDEGVFGKGDVSDHASSD